MKCIKRNINKGLIIFLSLFLFSCSKKKENIFNFADTFKKVTTINLNMDEKPEFIFTKFGFYTYEVSFSKISKYNNNGKLLLSFGKKGKGPGEIEMGLPYSYSEIDDKLGIYDVTRFSVSYFDSNGEFLKYGKLDMIGIPKFQYRKKGLNINHFIKLPENSTKSKYKDVIIINDKTVLEKDAVLNKNSFDNLYLYAINNNMVFILDRKDNDFDIFSYNSIDKILNKIKLDKSGLQIDDKQKIIAFCSIGDFFILTITKASENSIEHYFFNLKGKFLGTSNFEKGNQMIAGAYNNYLYIYKFDAQDNHYVDIYEIVD